jgi:hypothetical protein
MKSRLMVLLSGIIVVVLLAACQGTSLTGTPPQRQISVSGVGKVYLIPDIAYIYVGVRTQEDNVGSALRANNEQANTIASTLTALGVAAEDIQTTAFNVYPMQEYTPEGTPGDISYVVENTVYVTVRDLQNLGGILDEVVGAGANTINGISFDIADRTSAEAEARRLAVEDAKAKAVELAGLAGVSLGELTSVSVYNSGGPTPVYEAKGGRALDSSAPIASGQLVIQVDASLAYEIK